MKECDIIKGEGQNILPLTYFREGRDRQPQDLCPCPHFYPDPLGGCKPPWLKLTPP